MRVCGVEGECVCVCAGWRESECVVHSVCMRVEGECVVHGVCVCKVEGDGVVYGVCVCTGWRESVCMCRG